MKSQRRTQHNLHWQPWANRGPIIWGHFVFPICYNFQQDQVSQIYIKIQKYNFRPNMHVFYTNHYMFQPQSTDTCWDTDDPGNNFVAKSCIKCKICTHCTPWIEWTHWGLITDHRFRGQWNRSPLVQVGACRLFVTKQLHAPMLSYCQLDH